ncbi:MAG: hypothetical protein AAGA45_04035 [Verrucomicrobiota bacterium]
MPNRRSAFTLIELLAATGIMVVMVLLVLNLTTQVLDTWSYSTGKLTQNFESRVAIDMVTEDLQTAVFRNNQKAWLEVRQNTAGTGAPSGTDTFSELHFFAQPVNRQTTSGTQELLGDVCLMTYKVAYQNPFTPTAGSGQQFGLYRSIIDSENTFNIALDIGDFPPLTNNLTALWSSGQLARYADDGTTDANLTYANITDSVNYLSANVVDFQVRFAYESTVRDGDGDYVIEMIDNNNFPGYAGFIYNGAQVYLIHDSSVISDFRRLVYADISVTVLNDEGAGMLDGGFTPDDWYEFKAVFGETFSRRVYLMSQPL